MHRQSPLFLAQLALPVRNILAATAVECAGHVARTLAFNETETLGTRLAVEEAFRMAVAQYPGEVDAGERIYVEFRIEEGALVISLRDKGIPFDREQAARFAPGAGDSGLAMHRFMDSVRVVALGRDGRELLLTKRLCAGELPAELAGTNERTARKRTTVREPIIRLARRAEDIIEVCRLAWRCYGFTQEELLYDPSALIAKMAEGSYRPVIAVDPGSGNIFGHIGLKYHTPGDAVPEMGLAFVDPAYRSAGLPQKMARVLFDAARADGAKGIFDCSVTTHVFSQKGMHDMGSRPCCLMLGIAASGMRAKELATSRQDKGSVVNHYYAFDRSPRTIHIPAHHQAMVRNIYSWMEVPRAFAEPVDVPVAGESRVSVVHLPDALNASFIVVEAIGADAPAEIGELLHRCRLARKDAVFLFIPTHDPASPGLVEHCEDLGFFFSGVMPHIHGGGDRILLQFVDIPLDLGAVKVFGDLSATLFDYVQRAQGQALGSR